MQISADKAHFLFGYYRDRSTCLQMGGKICGEEATSDAVITAVDRELRVITVELSDPGSSQVWHRVVPLQDATYSLHLLGEQGFEEWVARRWHSVLVLKYPDGTTLFLAERMV